MSEKTIVGLLSQFTEQQAIDPLLEKFAELVIRVDLIKAKSQAPEALLGRNFELESIEFRERLLDFAIRQGISLVRGDWYQNALVAAAKQHPELHEKQSKRGKKAKPKGLLTSNRSAEEFDLKTIEAIDALISAGKYKSQKDFLESYVKVAHKNIDPEIDKIEFDELVESYRRPLSNARTYYGKSLKAGRKMKRNPRV